MFKSNGGFTLVELIVVIAILAILATIAVPAYSKYVSKAEDAVADFNAVADQEAVYDQLLEDVGLGSAGTNNDAGNQGGGTQ